MKETYKKIILQQRSKKLGIPPPPKTGPSGLAAVSYFMTVTLLRPVDMLFTEPIVFFISLYTGFNFSVLFGFFDAFPIVFEGVHHFDSGLSGLAFLGIGLGCVLAVPTAVIVDRVWYRRRYEKSLQDGKGGYVAPEHRLYLAMMGSFGRESSFQYINPLLRTRRRAVNDFSIKSLTPYTLHLGCRHEQC